MPRDAHRNPWAAYALPSAHSSLSMSDDDDDQWEAVNELGSASVTSPMTHSSMIRSSMIRSPMARSSMAHSSMHQPMSYLDKVRSGLGPWSDRSEVAVLTPPPPPSAAPKPSHSASSSTTPFEMVSGYGRVVEEVLGGCGGWHGDAYALENMVADTTGEGVRGGKREGMRGGSRVVERGKSMEGEHRASLVSAGTNANVGHFLPVPSGKREQGEGCEDASQVRAFVVRLE